jgi:pimeloyl-ACP methyl ester carboxylesterase
MLCFLPTVNQASGDEVGSLREPERSGVVFAVNGSGNLQFTSTALEQAVADEGLPLTVVTFEWSTGSVVTDHTDWQHAQEQGCRLAGDIMSYHEAHPSHAIHVVAHSAGTGVALTALAALPPGMVSRVILLAPSVSTDYDLRPALRCPKDGIDVFYSHRDIFSLGFGVAFVGTSDGCKKCPVAGRFGFTAQAESPEEEALYAKLRQHPWDRCQARAGNPGFHSGARRPKFLHNCVLPLLTANPSAGN